jgi:hypothetical protein
LQTSVRRGVPGEGMLLPPSASKSGLSVGCGECTHGTTCGDAIANAHEKSMIIGRNAMGAAALKSSVIDRITRQFLIVICLPAVVVVDRVGE